MQYIEHLFSRETRTNLAKAFALLVGCASVFLCRAEANVTFHSARTLTTSPELAEVEIVTTYDGTLGPVFLAATVRSNDGGIRSSANIPIAVPAGKEIALRVKIPAPQGLEEQRTDQILGIIYRMNEPPLARALVPWKHTWPQIEIDKFNRRLGRLFDVDGFKETGALFNTFRTDGFTKSAALLDKWKTNGEMTLDGRLKVEAFLPALSLYAQVTSLDEAINFAQAARMQNAESQWGLLAEARYWQLLARSVRKSNLNAGKDGKGTGRTANDLYLEASNILDTATPDPATNPIMHQLRLELAFDLNLSRDKIVDTFRAGIKESTGYVPLFLVIADKSKTPIQGDHLAILQEVLSAAETTDKLNNHKSAIYAQLAAYVDWQNYPEQDLFATKVLSWPKTREGFRSILRSFPNSVANLNRYAYYACRMNDKVAYLSVRPKLRTVLSNKLWANNHSPDLCDYRFGLDSL